MTNQTQTATAELEPTVKETKFNQPSASFTVNSEVSLNAGKQTYYRSRLLALYNGINPLVAVASPLLSMNVRLKTEDYSPDMSNLHQQLIHEINAFVSTVQNRGYRNEAIVIARYLLCALLDETVLTATWADASLWEQQRLLTLFHGEASADDRFFYILERLRKDPTQYLELLELAYLCLNLGFEGKYRYENNGQMKLLAIMDELFHLIRGYKKSSAPLLAPQLSYNSETNQSATSPIKSGYIWFGIGFILIIGLIALTYNMVVLS